MVRYTLVPRARSWEFLDHVHGTVPETPEEIEDCCGHVHEHTAVASREHAREWLVFLRALDCAQKGPAGYYRIGKPDRPEAIAEAFETNLFGVRELLTILSDASNPLTADAFCERLDASERGRLVSAVGTVESACESVERRLQWADLFELVSRRNDRYYLAVCR